MNKTVLFKTVIGSHMWKMERPGSDIDYFTVFAYPTKELLRGYHPKQSFFYPGEKYDEHMHEIEKVINQLLTGNVNFVFGVMSPIVVETSKWHKELKRILEEYPPKNIYHSIRGLAVHNYKLYVEKKKDTTERRMNKILRVLQFGITLLRTGRYEFKPYSGGTPEMVLRKIEELDYAYRESKLSNIPEKLLRDLLYKIRIDMLD